MGSRSALRKRPLVIAHRGASGYLPEHTLAAKALAHAMGTNFIEQDVVLSRDGIPVVLHDIYLESTTDVAAKFPKKARSDGSFYAIDFTLEELRQLRVHERGWRDQDGEHSAYYAKRFPPQSGLFHLHTLAEELALIDGLNKSLGRTAGIYLELKAPNWHAQAGHDMVRAIIDTLDSSGYLQHPDRVFLQCFDHSTLKRLARELPAALPLIQLIGENDWGEDSDADYEQMRTPEGLAGVAAYATGIGPHLHQILTGVDNDGHPLLSALVQNAHAQGLEVHPYTFRRDELPPGIASFEQLLDIFVRQAHVDGLFTDFPDLVVDYLAGDT